MCLTINKNNLKPITAEQDIVCYKVLRELPNCDILNAPIYHFEYCFGIIYGTHEDYFSGKRKFRKQKDIVICDDGECLLQYGFHSFLELSDAVRFKLRLLEITQHSFDYVVVKCTIPKGFRYYTGKQIFGRNEDNSPNGYCSEAIRIDEIVNENEN